MPAVLKRIQARDARHSFEISGVSNTPFVDSATSIPLLFVLLMISTAFLFNSGSPCSLYNPPHRRYSDGYRHLSARFLIQLDIYSPPSSIQIPYVDDKSIYGSPCVYYFPSLIFLQTFCGFLKYPFHQYIIRHRL